jgi:probable F420-dependent oxidoreductase
MRLGVMLPLSDIGGDPATVRDFALAAEAMGYTNLGLPDHVLGVNAASRPDWGERNTSADLFHDPFVCFAYLAALCRPTTEFSTQVLILAQRQAALVAKQAASLDVLCGGNGRFRLGIGVGWNEVEFTGLNEEFHTRGKRSADQVRVMQALWAEPHVKYQSEFHHIDDAGINPRPASGRVPIWYGGHAEATFRRAARYGDGFMPLAYPMGDAALAAFDKLRGLLRENGRDPNDFGLEVWVSPGTGGPEDWRKEIAFWKNAGVTHATVHTTYASPNHKRIPGKTPADHLDAITAYKKAVADLL